MRPWRDCNRLGKLCIVCCCLNIFFAFSMAMKGESIAILNGISAFACGVGSFSRKCKNDD